MAEDPETSKLRNKLKIDRNRYMDALDKINDLESQPAGSEPTAATSPATRRNTKAEVVVLDDDDVAMANGLGSG